MSRSLCPWVLAGVVAMPVWLDALGAAKAVDRHLDQAADEFGKGALPADTARLTAPKPKTTHSAQYTSAALRAHIEGEVNVDLVVDADGSVREARLSKEKPKDPLHDGKGAIMESSDLFGQLRDSALRAVRTWTFTPAQLGGKPVAVIITQSVRFRIQ